MNRRRRCFLMLFILPVLLCLSAAPPIFPATPAGKKVITFGGGGGPFGGDPDTAGFRKNAALWEEKMPVDGILLSATPVVDGKAYYFPDNFFGCKTFKLEDFQSCIEDLKNTKTTRFTDNFLRLNVMPGNFDWFDEETLKIILDKAGIAATIVREGGLKGILLDTEQYGSGSGVAPFTYHQALQEKGKKSFAEYQDKIEDFGYRLGKIFAKSAPGMVLLLTYGTGWVAFELGDQGKYPLSASSFDLLPSFVDGLLKVKRLKVFDVYEGSYGYKKFDQFSLARKSIYETAKRYSRYPGRYTKKINAGYGIWFARTFQNTTLDQADFSKNYFTPEELEYALSFGLEESDGYVWLYMGDLLLYGFPWQKCPDAYKEAIIRAKTPHDHTFQPKERNLNPNAPHKSNPPKSIVIEAEDCNPELVSVADGGEMCMADTSIGRENIGQHGRAVSVVAGISATGTVRFTFPQAIPDGIYKLRARFQYPYPKHDTTIQWMDGTNTGTVKPLEGTGSGRTTIYFGKKDKGTWVDYVGWTWVEIYGPDQPFKENNFGWKEFKDVGPNGYYIEIGDNDKLTYDFVWIDQFELVRKE